MKLLIRAFITFLISICFITPAFASVVLSGTRVIFNAAQDAATMQLTNRNKHPSLVEAWVDQGNAHSTPDNANAPFIVNPPLFRMNAGAGQSLRILYTGDKHGLPTNRESLFWLNVLEIPPKPTGHQAHQPHLQFAIRTRIKLFYRPSHLSLKRSKAPSRLTWKTADQSGTPVLQVHNPTPYYLTLAKVSLRAGGHSHDAQTGMVAPFSSLTLRIQGIHKMPAPSATVSYSTINDFGSAVQHSASVSGYYAWRPLALPVHG